MDHRLDENQRVAKDCRYVAGKLHALANEATVRDTRVANDCRALAVKLNQRAAEVWVELD